MKQVLVCLALAALVVVAISVSPMKCPDSCNLFDCRQVYCLCGAHKDECGCCTVCYKCPGEACFIGVPNQCPPGTVCKSTTPPSRYGPGICQ